ncbi:unnamed protein product [Amoebophrya sp. A25]|nr:unnamed protein product [Amoebophrya sp. A25]|eukprot:GSA25T00006699001.1
MSTRQQSGRGRGSAPQSGRAGQPISQETIEPSSQTGAEDPYRQLGNLSPAAAQRNVEAVREQKGGKGGVASTTFLKSGSDKKKSTMKSVSGDRDSSPSPASASGGSRFYFFTEGQLWILRLSAFAVLMLLHFVAQYTLMRESDEARVVTAARSGTSTMTNILKSIADRKGIPDAYVQYTHIGGAWKIEQESNVNAVVKDAESHGEQEVLHMRFPSKQIEQGCTLHPLGKNTHLAAPKGKPGLVLQKKLAPSGSNAEVTLWSPPSMVSTRNIGTQTAGTQTADMGTQTGATQTASIGTQTSSSSFGETSSSFGATIMSVVVDANGEVLDFDGDEHEHRVLEQELVQHQDTFLEQQPGSSTHHPAQPKVEQPSLVAPPKMTEHQQEHVEVVSHRTPYNLNPAIRGRTYIASVPVGAGPFTADLLGKLFSSMFFALLLVDFFCRKDAADDTTWESMVASREDSLQSYRKDVAPAEKQQSRKTVTDDRLPSNLSWYSLLSKSPFMRHHVRNSVTSFSHRFSHITRLTILACAHMLFFTQPLQDYKNNGEMIDVTAFWNARDYWVGWGGIALNLLMVSVMCWSGRMQLYLVGSQIVVVRPLYLLLIYAVSTRYDLEAAVLAGKGRDDVLQMQTDRRALLWAVYYGLPVLMGCVNAFIFRVSWMRIPAAPRIVDAKDGGSPETFSLYSASQQGGGGSSAAASGSNMGSGYSGGRPTFIMRPGSADGVPSPMTSQTPYLRETQTTNGSPSVGPATAPSTMTRASSGLRRGLLFILPGLLLNLTVSLVLTLLGSNKSNYFATVYGKATYLNPNPAVYLVDNAWDGGSTGARARIFAEDVPNYGDVFDGNFAQVSPKYVSVTAWWQRMGAAQTKVDQFEAFLYLSQGFMLEILLFLVIIISHLLGAEYMCWVMNGANALKQGPERRTGAPGGEYGDEAEDLLSEMPLLSQAPEGTRAEGSAWRGQASGRIQIGDDDGSNSQYNALLEPEESFRETHAFEAQTLAGTSMKPGALLFSFAGNADAASSLDASTLGASRDSEVNKPAGLATNEYGDSTHQEIRNLPSYFKNGRLMDSTASEGPLPAAIGSDNFAGLAGRDRGSVVPEGMGNQIMEDDPAASAWNHSLFFYMALLGGSQIRVLVSFGLFAPFMFKTVNFDLDLCDYIAGFSNMILVFLVLELAIAASFFMTSKTLHAMRTNARLFELPSAYYKVTIAVFFILIAIYGTMGFVSLTYPIAGVSQRHAGTNTEPAPVMTSTGTGTSSGTAAASTSTSAFVELQKYSSSSSTSSRTSNTMKKSIGQHEMEVPVAREDVVDSQEDWWSVRDLQAQVEEAPSTSTLLQTSKTKMARHQQQKKHLQLQLVSQKQNAIRLVRPSSPTTKGALAASNKAGVQHRTTAEAVKHALKNYYGPAMIDMGIGFRWAFMTAGGEILFSPAQVLLWLFGIAGPAILLFAYFWYMTIGAVVSREYKDHSYTGFRCGPCCTSREKKGCFHSRTLRCGRGDTAESSEEE